MPSRLPAIGLCLESLFTQTFKPNRIILWLTHDELAGCSPETRALLRMYEYRNLEIKICKKDIRSYKKCLYALSAYPHAILVTADDDIIYPRDWLERLWKSYLLNPDSIHCYKAHTMRFDNARQLKPYLEWSFKDDDDPGPSFRLFPAGCHGVLYPPKCLDERVFDEELFSRLTPTNDDIWWKAMSLLKETTCVKLASDKYKSAFFDIYNPHTTHLYDVNVLQGKNDKQLHDIFEEFSLTDLVFSLAENRSHQIPDCSLTTKPQVPWHHQEYGDLTITRMGSSHGGWHFIDQPTLQNSTIICAGLGEDISFEVEFASRYRATIIMVDPTPQAITHVHQTKIRCGKVAEDEYHSDGKQKPDNYDLLKVDASQLQLLPMALWKESTSLPFYEPPISEHVSHSISNYQNNYRTDTPHIVVSTITLEEILETFSLNRHSIPLLKLDIEGAEIEILSCLLDSNFRPQQICVEFDEARAHTSRGEDRYRIIDDRLRQNGYTKIFQTERFECLYLYTMRVPHQSQV